MTLDDALKEQGHFRMEIESAIQHANREVLNPLLPPVNVNTVLPFAVAVAKLRGHYLRAAFKLSEAKEAPVEAEIDNLKRHREAYDEARNAFEALMRAIDRGYIDLARAGGSDKPAEKKKKG